MKSIELPLPPKIEEQEAIVAHLDLQSAAFRTAISRLSREIDLLHEYRTRLVSDVVTGKLDVREVAAGLPEEVLEEEAVEPLELEAEDEEAVG
jgi:restriction endonuclease S subunit